MSELRELIELLTAWHDDMNRLETERLKQPLSLGSKIQKFAGKASILSFSAKRKTEEA